MTMHGETPDPEGHARLLELSDALREHPMGETELVERRMLGDDEYERRVSHNRTIAEHQREVSQLNVESTRASVTAIAALGFLRIAAGIGILVASGLAIAALVLFA